MTLFNVQLFRLETDTDPNNVSNDNTEATDNDMYPDELDESPKSLDDKQYPDDDDYEEIPEDEE